MRTCQEWRTDLVQRTYDHWERGNALNATEIYIRELLPDELDYGRQCGDLRQRDDCDTLVLLLGFSPDPLLQSIWVYQPRRIVLVCNHEYGFGDDDDPQKVLSGRQWSGLFLRYIRQLQAQGLYQHNEIPKFDQGGQVASSSGDIAISSGEATPDWVFRQLCDRILPRRRQATDEALAKKVVVDITGAKKNIMAGAFLFADYAGTTISYVDFADYDSVKHRPYGFTCRIGEQPNPYQILSLRDWARVRDLYERFFFRAAKEEVGKIEQRMRSGIKLGDELVKYFKDVESNAVQRLGRVLHLLELWDNGDHTEAWKYWTQENPDTQEQALQDVLAEPKRLALPEAVQVLGNNQWPTTKESDAEQLLNSHQALKYGDGSDSIFTRMNWLVVYAEDEVAKIRRLIDPNEDYRSAFLRAAALDELLLKARVALMWNHHKLNCSRPVHQNCFNAIVEATNSEKMREFLREGQGKLRVVHYDSKQEFFLTFVDQLPQSEYLNDYWQSTTNLSPQQMVKLRGESIHTYLPIPIKIAKAACEIATRAVDDFFERWACRFDPTISPSSVWQPDWDSLCAACGVTFLPPEVNHKTQEVSR